MYDYYNKKVDGLLYQVDIPRASGFSNIYSNIGDYKAWGHEITLQSRNLVGDFKWTTNLNIAFNRNEITKWEQTTPQKVDIPIRKISTV